MRVDLYFSGDHFRRELHRVRRLSFVKPDNVRRAPLSTCCATADGLSLRSLFEVTHQPVCKRLVKVGLAELGWLGLDNRRWRYSPLDCINSSIRVNNAGGQFPAPMAAISKRGFDAVVTNNLTGGVTAAQPGWTVSGNGIVQDQNPLTAGYYDDVFLSSSLDPVNGQHGFILRKIPSRIANRLIRRITGLEFQDLGCSLKAYRADRWTAVEADPRAVPVAAE